MSRKIEETTKLAAKVEASHDAVRYYDYKDQYRLIDCLAQKHPLAEKGYQVIQNQDNGAAVVIYGEDKTLGLVLRSEEKRFWTEKDKVNIGRKWITETDVEVLFLERQSIENTKTSAGSILETLVRGEMPKVLTRGSELEGVMYRHNGDRFIPAKVSNDKHPELLFGTWEDAIHENFPKTPQEYAQSLAQVYLSASRDNPEMLYVLTDVVEGGKVEDGENNSNGYVQLMIEILEKVILDEESFLPADTRQLYAELIATAGVSSLEQLFDEVGLIWPAHAHHDHLGIPTVINDNSDLRDYDIGLAMRAIHHTRAASVITMLTGSTERIYGNHVSTAFENEPEMNAQSVRSIIRRMFQTARGGRPIGSYNQENEAMIEAILSGEIHSAARYPASAQHDGSRLRPSIKTVEYTDKSQHPDFLTMVGSNSASVLLQVIAIESQYFTPHEDVYSFAQQYRSRLFNPQFTDNNDADGQMLWESNYNRYGLEGTDSDGVSFRDYVEEMIKVFYELQSKYPALKDDATIASAWLIAAKSNNEATSLSQYMGIDQEGKYNPNSNGRGTGLIAEYKRNMSTDKLIRVQAYATEKQAAAIASNPTLNIVASDQLINQVHQLWYQFENGEIDD